MSLYCTAQVEIDKIDAHLSRAVYDLDHTKDFDEKQKILRRCDELLDRRKKFSEQKLAQKTHVQPLIFPL